LRENLSVGTATTSKVELAQERVWGTQGYAGLTYGVWKINLSAEYDVSTVNTFAMLVGVNF
jgi:hypothetical protein